MRRDGDRQAAGNGDMGAAGGEKRKPLAKWVFRGGLLPPFLFATHWSAED